MLFLMLLILSGSTEPMWFWPAGSKNYVKRLSAVFTSSDVCQAETGRILYAGLLMREETGRCFQKGRRFLVLESEEHALKRGADILARISGYGNSFDPEARMDFGHQGKGLKNAVSIALKDASLSPEDIDYVSSCANSTKGLDRMETMVIKDVFGEHAYKIPVSSIKSMIGRNFLCIRRIISASAVSRYNESRIIPPTVNYKEKDVECDLDYVTE